MKKLSLGYKGIKGKLQFSVMVGLVLIMFLLVSVFNFSVTCSADDGEELPFKLDFEIIKPLPEVTESYQEMVLATMEPPTPEIPVEAINMKTWIYQIKGDPKTVMEELSWPMGIQKNPLEQDDLGDTIDELIDDTGEKLTEIWGNEWLDKAKKAANKYKRKEIITQNYIYITNMPMSLTMTTVSSPLIDFKTMELYKGTYLILQKMTVEMTMPPTNMGN